MIHLKSSCCKCFPAPHGCLTWFHCGHHTWCPRLYCETEWRNRASENETVIQWGKKKKKPQANNARQWKKMYGSEWINKVYLRLMLCKWDSFWVISFPPSVACSLLTAAVMSAAHSSLSSLEQASRKCSTPCLVWSFNTSWLKKKKEKENQRE